MAADPTEFMHRAMPFGKELGMRAVAMNKRAVILELDWAHELTTAGEILHGGAVMALADAAGGCCAFIHLPGTSTIVVETEVRDDQDRLVAKTTQTQAVLRD